MQLRRSRCKLLCACLVIGTPVAATAQGDVDEVRACLRRNVPKHSTSQVLEFVYDHPARGKRECRAKVFDTRAPDGLRAAKVCMLQPSDLAGLQLLSHEVAGRPPRTSVYLPDIGHAKPVSGDGLSGRVCGSDVSYEDLQRLQQLNRPELFERLPDGQVEGREVFVLQAKPVDPSQSAYTKVLSYVDKVTCVVLKSESFQGGDKLRKVMTTMPEDLLESDGIRVPSRAVVEDLQEGSHTTITCEDLKIDDEVQAKNFTDASLERRCH